MGQTQSELLEQAIARDDVEGAQRAMDAGADVNAPQVYDRRLALLP